MAFPPFGYSYVWVLALLSLLASCLVLHWSYRLEPGSAAPFLPAGLYENHLQVSAQILLSPFGVGIGSLTKTMRGNGNCLMAFALRHEQVKLVLTAYHSLSYRHPRSSTVQPKLLSGPRSYLPQQEHSFHFIAG